MDQPELGGPHNPKVDLGNRPCHCYDSQLDLVEEVSPRSGAKLESGKNRLLSCRPPQELAVEASQPLVDLHGCQNFPRPWSSQRAQLHTAREAKTKRGQLTKVLSALKTEPALYRGRPYKSQFFLHKHRLVSQTLYC